MINIESMNIHIIEEEQTNGQWNRGAMGIRRKALTRLSHHNISNKD